MLLGIDDFFTFDFLLKALIGTILLSICTGIISPFIVAKKYAFMGSAISHSTLLSLSLTYGVFGITNSYLAFLSLLFITLILNSFLAHSTYKGKVPEDSMIGIFFTATMGLGIIIHGLTANSSSKLMGHLFGNILLVENSELFILLTLLALTIVLIFPNFKSWIYSVFDPEGAQVHGLNTKLYHYIFFMLISLVIVSSVKIAGTVLINTFLIIPGVFALKRGQSIKKVFILSTLFSLSTALIGLILSNYLEQPTGAVISVIQFLTLFIFDISTKLPKKLTA